MDQGFSARVLTDSVSPAGVRLTTMEVRFSRFVLSEFNTHRTFCLDGDTKLYFDLPSAKSMGRTRHFTMTLRDLHEKWHQGSAARENRSRSVANDKLCLSATCSAKELAPLVGYADDTAVDLVTRRAKTPLDFGAWLNDSSRAVNRQPMRERLASMQLRSCNEESGEIYHTTIDDVCFSGQKHTYKVTLEDGRSIISSADHLFLTDQGWERLEDAVGLHLSANGVASWVKAANFSVNGIEASRDSEWLRARSMVRHFAALKSIEYMGVRETYDIEVAGPFHNFVADGFIVHNSRNSASSRAVPTNKMIERVLQNPAMPVEWGVNKPGMSASEALTDVQAAAAKAEWLSARDSAVEHVRHLQQFNVHKQVINRLLEPFMWHTVIVTATEWRNFFDLRCAPNAQPEIRVAAELMRDALNASKPVSVGLREWHLPLVQDDERHLPIEQLKKISAARCARVSYLTHDGKRDIEKDVELCDRLLSDHHLSPFEHVATPTETDAFDANFRGWRQMRHAIERRQR